MSLCIVFGRRVAEVVRREYLRDNLDFLWRISVCADKHSIIVRINDKTRSSLIESGMSTIRGAIEERMEANDWWSDACNASVFAQGGETFN